MMSAPSTRSSSCANRTGKSDRSGKPFWRLIWRPSVSFERQDITQKMLSDLLDYDPASGILTWRERPGQNNWNAINSGKPAMMAINTGGYRHGKIHSHPVLAHLVIWKRQTGRWPTGEIDHIDGDRTNNAFSNLREVSKSTNQRNAKLRADNSSGYPGVHFCKSSGKWKASIGGNPRTTLGTFDEF